MNDSRRTLAMVLLLLIGSGGLRIVHTTFAHPDVAAFTEHHAADDHAPCAPRDPDPAEHDDCPLCLMLAAGGLSVPPPAAVGPMPVVPWIDGHPLGAVPSAHPTAHRPRGPPTISA